MDEQKMPGFCFFGLWRLLSSLPFPSVLRPRGGLPPSPGCGPSSAALYFFAAKKSRWRLKWIVVKNMKEL
jgi:hypothetical protein